MSASLLALDLSRHPSGAAIADVADRVLALTPAELDALRGPASQAARERVLTACAGAPRMSTVMGGVAATVADGLPGPAVARTIVDTMAETLVGGLTDLLDLLRSEQPLRGAHPEAAQVALDAVTAAWAGRSADLADLVQLRAPWAAGVSPVPPSLPEAPYGVFLRRLLDEVSRRTPEQWDRVARAHRSGRAGVRWSVAMHEACQAAYDADRLLEVARAQLVAARGLRLSGASSGPHAHAVAMSVTAAVQAVCTADLLDTAALMRAWDAGS